MYLYCLLKYTVRYVIFLVALLVPVDVIAVTWTTTFDCAEWTQADGLTQAAVNCDSMRGKGSWVCQSSPTLIEDQITSAANHAAGDGGLGFRHWINDGTNINGGGLWLDFSDIGGSLTEFWFRYYMRAVSGFTWTASDFQYIKHHRVEAAETGVVIPVFQWESTMRITIAGTPIEDALNKGWDYVMDGGYYSTGDGLWHLYEFHIKRETTIPSSDDGVVQMWIDEELVIDATGVDTNAAVDWDSLEFGSNAKNPNNGGCASIDYDDFKLSTDGYIGPLAAAASTVKSRVLIIQ